MFSILLRTLGLCTLIFPSAKNRDPRLCLKLIVVRLTLRLREALVEGLAQSRVC
jgi:hypothetical protein